MVATKEEKKDFKNCKTCRFAVAVPSAVIGQWQGCCIRFPPAAVVIPVMQQGRPGMAVQSIPVPITDQQYCYEYRGADND